MQTRRFLLMGGLLAGLLLMLSAVFAQSNETILTIGINEWQRDMFSERALQGFYDANPGVKVVLVTLEEGEDGFYGLDLSNLDESLDKAAAHFSQADIMMVADYNLSPLVTRAGYVLDMTPYVRADGSGAIDDFHPVGLQVFQWDNAQWAIPIALRTNFMTYNPEAFDTAGYPYPDATWTLSDYLDAGRALTVRDDSGNITLPGMFGFDERVLIRTMTGSPFYDNSGGAEIPRFDAAAIGDVLQALDAYNEELMGEDPDPENSPMQNWDWGQIPIQYGGTWMISEGMGRTPHVPVLLSGDTALISAEGFAISAGTQNPDLAYALIMHLTSDIEIVSRIFGDAPARRSLQGQEAENFFGPPVSEAVQELLPTLLENGLPASELRYGDYLYLMRQKMGEDESLTFEQAFAAVQEQALSDLAVAEARRGTGTPIAVATPVPTPVLASGEVALKFLLQTNMSPMPNREEWEAAAQEFADFDPEVGYVEFVTGFSDMNTLLEEVDCAYTAYNLLPFTELAMLQPLEPFFAMDTALDQTDMPASFWTAVTREGAIYGLPMTVQPHMMWYNPVDLENAGVFPPSSGWTVSDFMAALSQLKDANPDAKPYRTQGAFSYVLLAAALGGTPIDYSTYIPTYNLTDPAVVEALRQLLDMAKAGLIDYQRLDINPMAGGMMMSGGEPTFYDGPGFVYNWEQIGTEFSPHIPTTFPRGTNAVPVSYNLGIGFLTAQTPYADACYRWLSTVAQRPDLFMDMPARRSHLSDERLLAAQGQTAVDFYTALYADLDDPQAVPVTGFSGSSPGAWLADTWFNQAMDAYVLDNADLDTALADAQTKIEEYGECIAPIPPPENGLFDQETWEAYYKQFTDCAVAVDPDLAERFEPQED